MSEVQALGQTFGAPDVRLSIARAAQATGVDFKFLVAQAKLESNLNPQARAGTSSAAGLYQFLGSTWLDTLDKHGEQYGLGWAGNAIRDGENGSKIVDRAMSGEIMALRYDPDASSLMAAELTRDNRDVLRTALGREPDYTELYMAHFLGSEGASRFLLAMQQDPQSSAAALFPKQAAANRPVFYDDSGAPRSLGEVFGNFRQKLGSAMGQDIGMPPQFGAGSYGVAGIGGAAGMQQADTRPMGPLAREFQNAAASHSQQGRPSMVDTLRETFASSSGQPATLPDNVRAAYTKLKAFGL